MYVRVICVMIIDGADTNDCGGDEVVVSADPTTVNIRQLPAKRARSDDARYP